MTRQCAWCDRYLSVVPSATQVTHGICDSCAERIRHTVPFTHVQRRPGPLLSATQARLRWFLHWRSERWFQFLRLSALLGWTTF